MRTQKQVIWDYFALLRLFKAVNAISHIDGNLKVQKLSFITEVQAMNHGIAAMHFKFFRYTHGPYSKDLAKDVDQLIQAEVLTTTRRLTRKGDFIIDYLTSDAQAADIPSAALDTIKQVASEYGKFSGIKLREIVYKMTVPVYERDGQHMKVRDIDTFTDILFPSASDKLRNPSSIISDAVLSDIQAEIDMPLQYIDPSNKSYQRTVNDSLQRIHAFTS